MARDTSRLSTADNKTYSDFQKMFGEGYADNWYDKNLKVMGLDAAPVSPPAPIVPVGEQVLGEILRPTTSQMQARLGVGEFAPRPEMKDIFVEEQKALESQKSKFVELGEKTDAEARLQIATDLTAEGLSPIGPTSEAYKSRFEEEYAAAQTAEKRAAEAVAPARAARTAEFTPRAPVFGATTIAKDPIQVESMGGFEAIASAFSPQILETPVETSAREERESRESMLNDSAKKLATEKGISLLQARREILDGTKQQFRMEAIQELGAGFSNEDYDAAATERYEQFLQENLPTEYRTELLDRGGAGASAAMVGDVRSRSLEFLVGAAASDKYDPQIYKEFKQKLGVTPKTESVVESLPMTIVRDLAGISRFVFNPLLDLAFYDVDPLTEEKINPEEFGFLPRERTGAKEQGAWGKSYIAARTPGSIDDSLREIAVEIATARSLGDDLAAQKAVRPEQEDVIRGLGILAEVALPINIFSVPGKLAGAAGRAAKATRFADLPYVSGLIKASELAEDPFSIAPGLINAYKIDKNIYKPLVEAAKKGGISTADEIRKSTKFADALVDSNRVSVIEASNAGDRYAVLAAVAKSPDDLMTNPLYTAQVARLEGIAPEIIKALKDPSVNAKVLAKNALDNAMSSQNTITRDAAKLADSSISERFVTSFSEDELMKVRNAVRTSLQESLSNTILGQWSFITPNIVLSTKTAKSKFPGTNKTVVQELSDRTKVAIDDLVDIVPAGQSATFKLKSDINVDQLLKDSLVFSSPDRLRFYKGLFKDISAGSELTPVQYRALHNLVSEAEVGNAARNNKLGAFKVQGAGRAYKSASEPVELRSSLIQFSKQVAEEAAPLAEKIFRRSFRDAPVKRYVSDIMNIYAGAIESFPTQFSRTISSLGKKGFKEDQIFGEVLNRALVEPQGVSTVTNIIQPMSNESAQNALSDIMRIQFGVAADTPKGKAIDKMSLDYGRTSFINPADNAKTFLGKSRVLRDSIVNRFPELKDQEAITQGLASRIRGKDSLPDTILSHSAKITQDKILKDIVKKNRNEIYDNSAIAFFDATDTGITKTEIIDGVSAGLQARLDGFSGPTDILKAIKDAGINEDVINTYGHIFVRTINDYYIDVIRASHGFESADGAEVLRRLNVRLQEIEPGVLVFLPDSLSGDIKLINENLKTLGRDPIKASRVIETATEVERQAPGIMSRIFGDLGSLAGYTHKNIAEGMLAGKVIPNVTYLSENVFTAPLIAAVTNPKYIGEVLKNVPRMAFKTAAGLAPGGEFGRFGGYTSDLYEPALRYPNKVAFVTPTGEQITNARLYELFTQARVGAGQAETVLRPQAVAQLKQLAEIVGAESKIMQEAGRRFKDFAPSANASIPMTVAQNTDMAFRQALFKEALKLGKTPEEAATIARETLLDYGLLDRVLPDQMKSLKAPFMFLSFSVSMSAAILKGLTRGESAENILRAARYHREMAKYSGVYAPGQAELESLYTSQQQYIGDKPATYSYFRDPIMGQIFWGANVAQNLTNLLRQGETASGTLENLLNETAYTPYTGFIIDIIDAYKGSMVPPRQIVFAQSAGLWPLMQSNFDIEEMPIEKMRRGEPTFEGKQYRFKSEVGRKKYLGFMFMLTMAGHNRTLNDYTNMLVAGGYAPEGAYLARYYPENTAFEGVQADPSIKGFVNGALYMILRQRATKPPTQIEVYDRQIETELRKLKDLQPKLIEE